MKLWFKYLLGILLGVIAAFILPVSSPVVQDAVTFISDLAIRFGRYTLLPMLFFSAAYAMFKLREKKLISKAYVLTFTVIVVSSLFLTFFGIASILLVKLPRMPIASDQLADLTFIDAKDLLRQLVPFSSFSTLQNGVYLLPAFIFASLFGAGCASDTAAFKPVITLFEAAAKLCYSVMSFFIEFMMIAMIAISCYWTLNARAVFAAQTFVPLTIMLLVDFVIVVAVIYPLVLYFVCRERHPYRVLYASLCPILSAFFSGDANFALLVNLKHGRDSLGIHRRVSGVTYPLFAIFARGGSALVTAICFIMILRSYSSLGFNMGDLVWIYTVTFGLSLLTCALPSGGAFVMLTIMCTTYSRGFDAGYLLVQPAATVFCSFAAAFDAATAMFGSYVIATKIHALDRVPLRHFV